MTERADVHSRPRPGDQPCCSCGVHADARTTPVLLCAGCLVRFHTGCWSGACGGCGGDQALGPVRAAPDASQVRIVSLRRPRPRVRVRRVALVLCLVAVAFAALGSRRAPEQVVVSDVDGWTAAAADAHVIWIPDGPVDLVDGPPPLPDDVRRESRAAMWALVDEARTRLARGDRQGALLAYDRALEQWTEEAAPWVERARLRSRLRDHAGALGDAERAIALAPSRVEARFQRAFALGERRRFDEADAEWTRVLQRAPHDAWAWNNRGFVRAHGGDPAGAIADCTRALELRPLIGYAFNNRAWARLLLGDLDGAAADVARSLELAPLNAWGHETRARVRALQGDGAGAVADLRRCLALDPDYPRSDDVRELMSSLVHTVRR